jgi:hypothetical protein
MRRTLAAAALVAVAATSAPAAQANPLQFERRCSGTVDALCYNDFCGIVSCVRSDCVVYSGVLGEGSSNAGICVGLARPDTKES